MSIAQFISQEEFSKGILEHDQNSVWKEQFMAFLERQWGALGRVDTKGHRVSFAELWNRLVDAKPFQEYEKKWLVESIVDTNVQISMDWWGKTLEEKYAKFVEWADGGMVPFERMMQPEGTECFKTGKKVRPVFTAPFQLEIFERSGPGYTFQPVTPYENPGVIHAEIDCPSGEMIVADWIRIPEFSDLYRANQDWSQEFSINHEAGRIRDTQRTLEKFNLLDLHLSNMAVKMFKKGGNIVIGDNYDPETDREDVPNGYRNAGSVCTDRWSLTAIDRVHLERILATVVDNPKEKVDAYLAEKNYGVSVQKWKPGTHHIYFCGDWREFQKTFQSPDFELPKMEVYAVISDHPLTLEHKVKMDSDSPSL